MNIGLKLRTLRSQRDHWIQESRRRHGVWSKAHNSNAPKVDQARLFTAWKQSVAKINQLNAQIKPLEPGASSASMPLAKATAQWEGGRSSDGLFHPYFDTAGSTNAWTIGYGHTNADGGLRVDAHTRPLTVEQATALLLHDLNTAYAPAVDHYLNRVYKWPLRQARFDALVDFAYNLGPGYFQPNHDIGAAMQKHLLKATANAMLEYDDPGSPAEAGLRRRREWEKQLFLGGSYQITN